MQSPVCVMKAVACESPVEMKGYPHIYHLHGRLAHTVFSNPKLRNYSAERLTATTPSQTVQVPLQHRDPPPSRHIDQILAKLTGYPVHTLFIGDHPCAEQFVPHGIER